jgi:DNA-binding XRE family transcriptional regulator
MSHKISKIRIIDIRNKQLWTQEDLASASGLSVRTIQRVESQGVASLETLKALAAAFNIDTEFLIEKPLNRSWVYGPIMGMVGGSIGCGFGYWGIIASAQRLNEPLTQHLPMLSFVSFMLAFALIYPSYTLHKYWNVQYDPRIGCIQSKP